MTAIVDAVTISNQGFDREPTPEVEILIADESFGARLPDRIHRPAWNLPLPIISEVENEAESFNAPTHATAPPPEIITLPRRVSPAHSQDHLHDSPNDR